ncbi:hypothetical protein F66182_4370 [Fusarium sp. NRRL 66182]|nr:hypothetical protein F66182_4370 [Fusarium sp. NRRL 66182]
MRYLSLFVLAAASSAVTGSVLESADFNVTQALLDKGVDVTKLPALANNAQRSERGCIAACASLTFLYGDAAVESRDEKAYDAFTDSYWSANQGEVNPYCIFKPAKSDHVSVLVLLARLTQCPFAAKSGGHAAFAGASSIEGGITISFANLKAVSLSEDEKIASIQPGNIWGDVFEQLAKSDLSVVGGRLYNIGVGGLTTGGGISYFSNLYGWACDNVESFEVVLANGQIVKASATQYPDLYWALRGGGNNFGLVVNFNLETISVPKGEMWGGSRVYTEDKFPELASALYNIINNSFKDPKAGLWVAWGAIDGNSLAIPTLYYSEPNGGNASIWDDFNAIESISDMTQDRVVAEWARENMGDSPNGLREAYYVITTKVDLAILTFARDYFYKTLSSVADIPGIIPAFVVQGITVPQIKNMQSNGGNALGIDVADGPLFIMQVTAMWNNKSDDEAIYSWMSDILTTVTEEAKSRRVNSDFVYMNYASQFQDVISSYGSSNKAKLKSISKKYDPRQVYQKLQPGYFKLDRAPVPNSGYFSH